MKKFNFNHPLRPSKHFQNTWLRKWNWDIHELRNALKEHYKIEKVGKDKYEVYIKQSKKSRKIIFVDYANEIFIITGAEGK